MKLTKLSFLLNNIAKFTQNISNNYEALDNALFSPRVLVLFIPEFLTFVTGLDDVQSHEQLQLQLHPHALSEKESNVFFSTSIFLLSFFMTLIPPFLFDHTQQYSIVTQHI